MTGALPPIEILYQDAGLVAVNKPAGEPVIPPGHGGRHHCLHLRLEAQLGERLWVVHRIDREASGLVVFARTADTHRALSRAFEHREVEKHYVAFAFGTLTPGAGRLDAALHAARRGKTRPAAQTGEPGAREAVTEYAIRRRWRRDDHLVSLVNLRPRTGRHHQIRVHMRAAGAPILFDPLYGLAIPRAAFTDAPCQRMALHARRLVVPHPTGLRSGASAGGRDVLWFEAPLAPDLVALGRWLNAHWNVDPTPT